MHLLNRARSLQLDPRDPLLQSERMQGFAADPVYAKCEVFAYGVLPQNLKDLKCRHAGGLKRPRGRCVLCST